MDKELRKSFSELKAKCNTKEQRKAYNELVSSFTEREKVSPEMLAKAKEEGVVQKKPNGKWGIISIQAGEWWIPDYDSKENAEDALKAYHANK